MKKLLRLVVTLAVIAFSSVPAAPAEAAGMSVKITSFGSSNKVTDHAVEFSIEYVGGLADTAKSCVNLMDSLGSDLTFDFTVDSTTQAYPTDYFEIQDAYLSSTAIRCNYSSNTGFAIFDEAAESKPVSMTVSWKSNPVVSVSGVLLNPNFPGSLTITQPTRGAEIHGVTSVFFESVGGQGRKMQDLEAYVCKVKCGYGTIPIQVMPRVLVGDNGSQMDGFAMLADDGTVKIYFEGTGIFEVRLVAHFGAVGAESSVFVNVVSSVSETLLSWNDASDLVHSSSARIGIAAKINCGNAKLISGVNRNCSASVNTNPNPADYLPGQVTSITTQVPVKVSTSRNGQPFKVVKTMTISTQSSKPVSVSVPRNTKTFTVRLTIDGYSYDGNYYSNNSYSDASWGPPPTSIKMSVSPTVFWGKAFTISISSSKVANGSCRVLQNNISSIANFRLYRGRGSATAKVVWGGGVGSQVFIPLFAYCTVGGAKTMAYAYTTGVR
jgi:hypothetical protein